MKRLIAVLAVALLMSASAFAAVEIVPNTVIRAFDDETSAGVGIEASISPFTHEPQVKLGAGIEFIGTEVDADFPGSLPFSGEITKRGRHYGDFEGSIEGVIPGVDLEILAVTVVKGSYEFPIMDGLSITPGASLDALFINGDDGFDFDNQIGFTVGADLTWQAKENVKAVAGIGYSFWGDAEGDFLGESFETDLDNFSIKLGVSIAI